MGELILNELPYAAAAALAAPVVAVVTAIILAESRRPLISAWTFTAGSATLVIAFSVALLAVAGASGTEDSSDVGPIVDVALGAIFLGFGAFAAYSSPDPEKEAAQQQRIRQAAGGGLGAMLAAGFVAQVVNVDALAVYVGALKEVALADVSTVEVMIAVLVAVAVMLVPYYGPALVYATSPERSGPKLKRMSDWLLARSRALEILVGLGFGATFLIKGIAGL